MTRKLSRGKLFHSRSQIINPFNAAILALALPLLLAACGGGGGGVSGNSSPAGAVGPSSATTSNSAALAWDTVTATNLAGYRVYYGTAPGNYLQPRGQGISVGNVTSYTAIGLSNGTRYYFAVTAFDTSGNESGYSNEAIKDIP